MTIANIGQFGQFGQFGTFDNGNAEKEKYDAVTGGADCLGEVLDRGVRLFGDVFEGIVSLDEPAADDADDAREMKYLGKRVRQISHAEYCQRLNNCNSAKKPKKGAILLQTT